MADVFLSYSRRDSAFVHRLAEALQTRGKEVWVDVGGIRDADVFPDALRRAVESTDAFVFVISPESVRSPFCDQEVERAAELNKRIVPLALRHVSDEEVPDAVRFRNWVPASDGDDFESMVERLVRALDTDLGWEREHTRLTVKAVEWEQAGRDNSFLLRGADLVNAERWLASGADKDPGPSPLERQYLLAARAAATRRQRGIVVASLVVAAVSIALLIFALFSRSDAIDARNTASAQALTSDAQRVGEKALDEKNLDRSLLFGVLGVQLQDRVDTRSNLLAVLQNSPALFRVIRPSRSAITALAASPDGRLLASGDTAGVVRFHDTRSWRQSGAAVRLSGSISQEAMTFSPDGDRLAVATATGGDRSNLYFVDLSSRTKRLMASWPSVPASAGPRRFTRMAFSLHGARIAVAVATASPSSPVPVAQRLVMLETKRGRVVWHRRYPLRTGQNEASVAFTRRGAVVTSAAQGSTLIWNSKTGRVERSFPIGGPFAVSPDGRFAALAQNNANPADPNTSLTVLDLQTGRHRSLPPLPARAWIISVAFTPDGDRIVSASFDHAVRVWDRASGLIVETFADQPSGENMAVVPGGRTVVSGGENGSVAAWDLSGSQRLGRTFRWNSPDRGCPTNPCFVINPQGTLMASDQGDGTVALIDLRTGRPIDALPARSGAQADALGFFPDGRQLAIGGINGKVNLWDVRTRRVLRTVRFGDPVWWVAVSPNGERLAAQTQAQNSSVSRIDVRDTASGRRAFFHLLRNGHAGLYFSPDGRRLAALGCCEPRSSLKVWDARSGKELFRPRFEGNFTAIAFSFNGDLLGAGTEDGKVLLLSTRDGSLAGPPIQVATGSVSTISFSPDSRLFAASSDDQTATLWDIGSRKRLGRPFPVRQAVIPSAQFTSDGDLVIDYLASAAKWPTNPRTWQRYACQVTGRGLTRAEWVELLPDRPYQQACGA